MESKITNLIIGKVESGKTRGICFKEVENLIQLGKNVFILDNKEEYYPRFKRTFEENGYKVKLINLRNPLNSNTFNLLKYPYQLYLNGNKDASISLVISIAKNVCISQKSNEDPFWENNASDYLASLILILFEEGEEEEINFFSLGKLIHVLNEQTGYERLKNYFMKLDVNSSIYKLGATTLFSPIDTRGGILSTLKYKINAFFYREEVLNILSIKDLSVSDLDEKVAIFFEGMSGLNAIANIILG
ncbi:MAG: type IV secretory system conjugative DNA transfer family protein [Bacilli bacterium]|nr:type IV secretory system conjugative DNA transfer family protein [Bacilli bacterium]